jgi:NAD(P)-dependent dehydrogenase (short-subunit alcohol dehydrogenase family)
MNEDFRGRHVVVTGGAGALGAAVLDALLARGASCYVPIVEAEPHPGFTQAGHPSVHVTAKVDLADEAAVTAFYAGLPSLWASIHLAGGFAMKPIADTSAAELRAQLELNATTCFLACREAVRAIRRGGPGVGGRIVNVAARPALAPVGGMLAYSMSKAAVAHLTLGLAAEVAAERILCNAVVPSIIDSPANRRSMPDADHASWPRPSEVAEAIGYLASPANSLTSGALVPVYGRA